MGLSTTLGLLALLLLPGCDRIASYTHHSVDGSIPADAPAPLDGPGDGLLGEDRGSDSKVLQDGLTVEASPDPDLDGDGLVPTCKTASGCGPGPNCKRCGGSPCSLQGDCASSRCIKQVCTQHCQGVVGSGATPADPKWITCCAELQAIGGKSGTLSQNYALKNDIDCRVTDNNDPQHDPQTWPSGFVPIGAGRRFTGSLDGKGFKITGLAIVRPKADGAALFYALSGAQIQDLSLEVDIQGSSWVGGIAAYAWSASLISACKVTGKISALKQIGGVVGRLAEGSVVQGCTASLAILGRAGDVGGIAGLVPNSATIQRANSEGAILADGDVGGLIGRATNASVKNSYSTMAIKGGASSNKGVGGLIGVFQGASVQAGLENSYFAGAIALTGGTAGGLAGKAIFKSGAVARNSFTVGEINGSGNAVFGTLTDRNVGGNALIAIYYDKQRTKKLQCTKTLLDPPGCTGINPGGQDADYFYGQHVKRRPVFVGWNFTTIWQSRVNALPVFR